MTTYLYVFATILSTLLIGSYFSNGGDIAWFFEDNSIPLISVTIIVIIIGIVIDASNKGTTK